MVAVTGLSPPYGSDQCWLAVFLQAASVSLVPLALELPGSVRHFPLAARTYSPFACRVHAWFVVSLHGSRNAAEPPVTHLPSSCSSRLAAKVSVCAALPVQDQMSSLLPLLLLPPAESTHFASKPLIAPGVELTNHVIPIVTVLA